MQIIEMPHMLANLTKILEVLSYGPDLASYLRYNVGSQLPIFNEVLVFHHIKQGCTDWQHFDELLKEAATAVPAAVSRRSASVSMQRGGEVSAENRRAAADLGSDASIPRSRTTVFVNHDGTPSGDRSTANGGDDSDVVDFSDELLVAFAPTGGAAAATTAEVAAAAAEIDGNDGEDVDGLGHRLNEIANLMRVMEIAVRYDIAELTQLGNALMATHPLGFQTAQVIRQLQQNNRRNRASNQNLLTVANARKMLQFHAIMLSPHQVEVVFVLCTLLSGRRKLKVQNTLATLSFISVLNRMFDRMSWHAPPFSGKNPMEHAHGPDCECNPESAVRIQFLRLVHNFFDKDFMSNKLKQLMLSESEREFVSENLSEPNGHKNSSIFRIIEALPAVDYSIPISPLSAEVATAGLLRRIISVLVKEPKESIYRFWLSSCIENFLRGIGPSGQLLVASCGVVAATVKFVADNRGTSMPTSCLQTCFDLLSETTKANCAVLELLEESLSDDEFDAFCKSIMENLIDSNVFLRSLYLSMELMHHNMAADGMNDWTRSIGSQLPMPMRPNTSFFVNSLHDKDNLLSVDGFGEGKSCGYLVDTWMQFQPQIMIHSTRGIPTAPGEKGRMGALHQQTLSAVTAPLDDGTTLKDRIPGFFTRVMDSYRSYCSKTVDDSALASQQQSTPLPPLLSFASSTNSPLSAPVASLKLSALSAGEGGISPVSSAGGHHEQQSSCGRSQVDDQQSLEVFGTPREGPSDESSLNPPSTCGGDVVVAGAATDTSAAAVREAARVDSRWHSNLLFMPFKLRRIARFLLAEKAIIVLRLISAVTISTINHENICCLNTALLIMLLELQRYAAQQYDNVLLWVFCCMYRSPECMFV